MAADPGPADPCETWGCSSDPRPGQTFLSGNWLWLGIIVVLQILNTVLGEALLFRGLLLPG